MNIAELISDWGGFEKLVAELHETGSVSVEHNVTLIGRSGAPRQIDVVIRHKKDLYEYLVVVECKYWNSTIDRAKVDALSATLKEVGAARGVIFSKSGFQSGAIIQAKADNIDLYTVRELSDDEWGSPGRVVDFFLQVIQPSVGNIQVSGGTALPLKPEAKVATNLQLDLMLGFDEKTGNLLTLDPDGSKGKALEVYIAEAAQEAMKTSLKKGILLNDGAECTRYMQTPVRLKPSSPFRIVLHDVQYSLPLIEFVLGIKIGQSRFTIDRADRLKFALALENCVTGKVVGASRAKDAAHTHLVEIASTLSEERDNLKNGSIIRAFIKGYFPFSEMQYLSPGPSIA